MNKNLISNLFKVILFGAIWAVIGFVIAILLVNSKGHNLKDVLFFEGIGLIVISIMSSIGGNSNGLSLLGLNNEIGSSISLFANLEITKREREKNPMKQTLTFAVSSVSLIIGGLLLILINYIL